MSSKQEHPIQAMGILAAELSAEVLFLRKQLAFYLSGTPTTETECPRWL
jgi:hypothetical protein